MRIADTDFRELIDALLIIETFEMNFFIIETGHFQNRQHHVAAELAKTAAVLRIHEFPMLRVLQFRKAGFNVADRTDAPAADHAQQTVKTGAVGRLDALEQLDMMLLRTAVKLLRLPAHERHWLLADDMLAMFQRRLRIGVMRLMR